MFQHRQMLQLRRNDGSDSTLLRKRPTNSRSDDAFVKPKLSLSSADSVAFLETVEGQVQCLRSRIYLMISMFNSFSQRKERSSPWSKRPRARRATCSPSTLSQSLRPLQFLK
jgi:hypothetical protein